MGSKTPKRRVFRRKGLLTNYTCYRKVEENKNRKLLFGFSKGD